MTSPRVRIRSAPFLAAALGLVAGCGGGRTPPAPPRAAPSLIETLKTGGTPALKPYLDAYPIGDLGSRTDLLAATREHSMHLVQTRRAVGRRLRPARSETVYVVTGTGTCYIGDRSYPIQPGSAFKIAPGTAYSALPAEGATIVAISYVEPPLTDGDDRVVAQ